VIQEIIRKERSFQQKIAILKNVHSLNSLCRKVLGIVYRGRKDARKERTGINYF